MAGVEDANRWLGYDYSITGKVVAWPEARSIIRISDRKHYA